MNNVIIINPLGPVKRSRPETLYRAGGGDEAVYNRAGDYFCRRRTRTVAKSKLRATRTQTTTIRRTWIGRTVNIRVAVSNRKSLLFAGLGKGKYF